MAVCQQMQCILYSLHASFRWVEYFGFKLHYGSALGALSMVNETINIDCFGIHIENIQNLIQLVICQQNSIAITHP